MTNVEDLRRRDLPTPLTAAAGFVRLSQVLLVLLVLAGTAACGGAEEGTDVVRRDSGGVEIVENPGTERALEWSFERVATLGGEMEGPVSFTSVSPGTVEADSAGNLYVLDGDAFRVVVFDGTLEPVRTLGSEGEGPGELAHPVGFDVRPSGETVVFDIGKGGFVRWGPDGALLPFRRPEIPFVSRFERTPYGVLLGSGGGGLFGEGEDNLAWIGYVDEGDTIRVATREVRGPGQLHLESCPLRFRGMGRVLEPRLVWTYGHSQGRLAVSPEAAYVIDLYRGTEKVRSVRRAVEPRAVTEEMAIRQVGEGWTIQSPMGEVTCEAEELIEKRGVASHLQAVDALRFAPDGSIWAVRGHVDGEEPAIDVFQPDGEYVGTLPPGTPVPILFLSDGRLVAEETDELDVDRLVVYEVDRASGGENG